MKITAFKLDKNKKFNYTPRYYSSKEDKKKEFKITSLIRGEKQTQSLTDKWNKSRIDSRNKNNRGINKVFVISVLVLLFLALYILDFDLSVFLKK